MRYVTRTHCDASVSAPPRGSKIAGGLRTRPEHACALARLCHHARPCARALALLFHAQPNARACRMQAPPSAGASAWSLARALGSAAAPERSPSVRPRALSPTRLRKRGRARVAVRARPRMRPRASALARPRASALARERARRRARGRARKRASVHARACARAIYFWRRGAQKKKSRHVVSSTELITRLC